MIEINSKADLIKLYYTLVDEVLDEDVEKLVMYLKDYIHNGSRQCFESEEDW